MNSFEWDEHFETGIPDVDRQHQRLVDLINRFGDLLTRIAYVPFAELESVLDELSAYAKFHFQDEEAKMLGVGLYAPYLDQHRELHLRFLHEVTQMRAQVTQHRDAAEPLLKFLIRTINGWLIKGLSKTVMKNEKYFYLPDSLTQ